MLKFNCFCGKEVQIKKEEYREPFKFNCENCRRCYGLLIHLKPEDKEFWL